MVSKFYIHKLMNLEPVELNNYKNCLHFRFPAAPTSHPTASGVRQPYANLFAYNYFKTELHHIMIIFISGVLLLLPLHPLNRLCPCKYIAFLLGDVLQVLLPNSSNLGFRFPPAQMNQPSTSLPTSCFINL